MQTGAWSYRSRGFGYLSDPDIDFVKLAGSHGVKGEQAARAADFEPALKRGIAATRDAMST